MEQVITEVSLGHVPYILLLRILPNLEQTEFSLRYPSVLFGTFGVAAAFAAGRRFGGNRTGKLAAFLLMLSPMHVWYSREARTYSLTVAVTLLTMSSFLNLWRQSSRSTWLQLTDR